MRKGTEYAKKLKKAYSKFRSGHVPPEALEPSEPVEQLLLAALSQETTAAVGRAALTRINEEVVDYNELRVSAPGEIAELIGDSIPRSTQRAKVMIRLLNAIFAREYAVSLDSLKSKGLRDAKQYLESLDGATPYVIASVLLWSLGGHAIPVNKVVLDFLAKHDLIDPNASDAEVQSFLERHVSAADARTFCLDLEAYAASRHSATAAGKKSPRARKPKAVRSPSRAAKKTRTAPKAKRKTARPKRKARPKTSKKKAKTARKKKRAR
jgi:endonuclease III